MQTDPVTEERRTPPAYCQYAAGPCDQAFDGAFHPEAFLLYPSKPTQIAQTIESAVAAHNSASGDESWKTWRLLPVAGKLIFCEICKAMRYSTSLIVDVTTLNFNLLFEIGFGIGLGLPVVPIRDTTFIRDHRTFDELGMLDTLGYVDFRNSSDLADGLRSSQPFRPLPNIQQRLYRDQPLYVLKSPHETDGQIQLMSAIKKSALKFRAYDPIEAPRVSLHEARKQVAASFGVIAHLVSPDREGHVVHNGRCALVCGLAMAQRKVVVLLGDTKTDQPIDYRDVVVTYDTPARIPALLERPIVAIVERLQSDGGSALERHTDGLLQRLDLGDVAAENEITRLQNYFVPTGQSNAARQGNARLVVGRKGSGKTAIFYQLRNPLIGRRTHLVLDLKPEGHQFTKLREAVLDKLSAGVKEHTLVAFWNYVLLAELARRIVDDWRYAKTDQVRLEAYQRVEALYRHHDPGLNADFSQRLLAQVEALGAHVDLSDPETLGERLTETLYSTHVRDLGDAVADYLTEKTAVWLLVDNLDKSWPIQGSTETDILIVRSLLEATRKLQGQLEDRGVGFNCLVFLRTDIYEEVVRLTPDKGKDTAIRLDWEDRSVFEEIIRKRITASTGLNGTLRELWPRLCVSHIGSEDTFNYVVDRTLMRPRDLLQFTQKMVEVALNRGHAKIDAEDILQAEREYSEDILLTTVYEIGDTAPKVADALYAFQGAKRRLSRADVTGILLDAGVEDEDVDRAIELLVWFGFLGMQADPAGDEKYSHTVHFNVRRLLQSIGIGRSQFIIHPAFCAALDIV